MNIQMRQDVSFLFSNLNKNNSYSSGLMGSNWLADYASIKNGSYGKLMKAYFNMDKNDEKPSSSSVTKEPAKVEESAGYAKVQTATDALKKSADALFETGKDSVFAYEEVKTKDEKGQESTEKKYDMDAIYKAVDTFVSDYNSVMGAVGSVDHENISSRTEIMANESMLNRKALSAVGISINEDGTLALDKDTFMKADVEKVQDLFQGAGSYGYTISARASKVNDAAESAAKVRSSYNANGDYSMNYMTGNLFESWF